MYVSIITVQTAPSIYCLVTYIHIKFSGDKAPRFEKATLNGLITVTFSYQLNSYIWGCNGFDCGLKFGEAIREEQRHHSKLNINAEDNLAYAA